MRKAAGYSTKAKAPIWCLSRLTGRFAKLLASWSGAGKTVWTKRLAGLRYTGNKARTNGLDQLENSVNKV